MKLHYNTKHTYNPYLVLTPNFDNIPTMVSVPTLPEACFAESIAAYLKGDTLLARRVIDRDLLQVGKPLSTVIVLFQQSYSSKQTDDVQKMAVLACFEYALESYSREKERLDETFTDGLTQILPGFTEFIAKSSSVLLQPKKATESVSAVHDARVLKLLVIYSCVLDCTDSKKSGVFKEAIKAFSFLFFEVQSSRKLDREKYRYFGESTITKIELVYDQLRKLASNGSEITEEFQQQQLMLCLCLQSALGVLGKQLLADNDLSKKWFELRPPTTNTESVKSDGDIDMEMFFEMKSKFLGTLFDQVFKQEIQNEYKVNVCLQLITVTLNYTNHYEEENKAYGLDLLNTVLKYNCSYNGLLIEKGYNHVIYNTFFPCVGSTNSALIGSVCRFFVCYYKAFNKTDQPCLSFEFSRKRLSNMKDFRATSNNTGGYDYVFGRMVYSLAAEDNLKVRKAYVLNFEQCVRYMGLMAVRYLAVLVEALNTFLTSVVFDTVVPALDLLKVVVKICKPRILKYSRSIRDAVAVMDTQLKLGISGLELDVRDLVDQRKEELYHMLT